MSLSDREFIRQFEQKTLPQVYFDHRGHLRLAWLYLNHCSLDEAIRKTIRGIKAYADSLGATGKFHHTLTEAVVRIMYGRLQQGRFSTLDAFLSANPDLVQNLRAVLRSYYSEDRLNSVVARRGFEFPDLRKL